MPDILLIQPPIRDFYFTAKRTIPYGLTCIAAALSRSGFTVDIFDGLATSKSKAIDIPDEMAYLSPYYAKPDVSPFALFHKYKHYGYSFEHIGHMAKASGAALIGISSLFTAYSEEALKTAETVKKFNPSCKVIMGGHHPTELPEQVMNCSAVDYIIRGEGELSLPMLVNALNKGEKVDHIPGIVFRKADHTLHINEPAVMDNLDKYPLPSAHLVKHQFYKRNKKGSTVIVSTRGCPLKCSYCCIGSGSCSTYRRRSISQVISEIDLAVNNHDAGFIDFEDENISYDRTWFLELMSQIERRYISHDLELRAMNGLFPPTLDDAVITAMKRAGFKTLNLALGSISKEQLKRFRRPDVRKSFETAVAFAKENGLDCVSYIIVSAPGQDAIESVNDLMYLFKKEVLAGVSVFYPAPGSPDYKLCETLGILPDTFSLMRSSALPLSHKTSRLESVTLLRLGRILNFIKSLIDNSHKIPSPAPCEISSFDKLADRKEMGTRLLKWLFFDGKIRGVTPDGIIYDHYSDKNLVNHFLKLLPHQQS
ncbi:MAG: B12-binding domain-containing radical SAM protein [Desulfobacterales bacterium]|nr:B12-binding domain-containing radical SAM protein [Desulfobacterales bacterium]